MSGPNRHAPPSSSGLISRALCLAAIAAALVTAFMGVEHWLKQGDPASAAIVMIAEIVALFGLSMVTQQWRRGARFQAAIASLLTLLCAGMCGWTTWARLGADAAARAAAIGGADSNYISAQREFAAFDAALQTALSSPGPTCTCPATIAAWQAAQEQRIGRLSALRDQADVRRVQAAPKASPGAWQTTIAVALEALKLFGWLAFSVAGQRAPSDGPPRGLRRIRTSVAAGLGILSLGAQPAAAGPLDTGIQVHTRGAAPPEPPRVHDITSQARRMAQAARMRAQGAPVTVIARHFGVHRNTIYNWLKRMSRP